MIDPQSFVVSDHLLDGDDEIRAQAANGEVVARVVGRDAGTDLALLRTEGAPLTPVTLATDPVRVGEIVLAAGRTWTGLVAHPGFVTHLSGPHQVSPGFRLEQAIHTSLEPFSGFSGGALVNVQGQVVGISTSALDRGRGLAIPARDVTRVVESLRRTRTVASWLPRDSRACRSRSPTDSVREAASADCSSPPLRPGARPTRRSCWLAT